MHEALAGVTISTTYYLLLATCYLAGVDAGDGRYLLPATYHLLPTTAYRLLLTTCYLAGVDAGDGQYHKITHRE